jgi:hypothetical protein
MAFMHDENFKVKRQLTMSENGRWRKTKLKENAEAIIKDRKKGYTVMELAKKYLGGFDIPEINIVSHFLENYEKRHISRRFG